MLSILKKLEKFFIAFLKWFLSWQTKNITTFPSPYRLTATPRTEEIKNKKTKKSHPLGTGKKIFLNWWLRQAIRFAKEKVTLNINLSYTDTRGAMVN